MRIALTTWQFVRLMVRLEETRRQSAARRTLYRAWEADWVVLDAELERLREEDFPAFSELMMEQEIVFGDETAEHALTAAEVAEEVAGRIAAERKGAAKEVRADLDFEHDQLVALAAGLREAAGRP